MTYLFTNFTRQIMEVINKIFLRLTSRCASQTAPEAQRKRNIRNAKTCINF